MMALGVAVYGKMKTLSKHGEPMLKNVNALFYTKSVSFFFLISNQKYDKVVKR